MNDWIDASEVANRLNLKKDTVKKYRLRGVLPEPDRFFGRTPVWDPQTIDHWESNRRKKDSTFNKQENKWVSTITKY
jgi:hypothetical protein